MSRTEEAIYSKSDSSYRKFDEEIDDGKCLNCNFYYTKNSKSGTCGLVKGTIDPNYTCNLFSSKER